MLGVVLRNWGMLKSDVLNDPDEYDGEFGYRTRRDAIKAEIKAMKQRAS
jgi:hypothetical protein